MRYLSSISLALVVLMALACTATPAEPTPATPAPAAPAPTSSGAFSCMELADKLAAAQTETAAKVLTRSWNESGCAQKVAGVTKVPTARPTASLKLPFARPTAIPATSTFMDRKFGKTPVPTDCVRVETTDARKNQSRAALSGYQLMLNWRVKNICDVAITAGQTIVIYDKDKSILISYVEDSAGVLRLPPGESLLYSAAIKHREAGGDAFHSYEIEVPWKPD